MGEFKTAEEVHNHARKAIGKSIGELNNYAVTTQTKGSVGNAFENWFGKKKDSASKPDMEEAGVELKATPFKVLKNGQFSAKERLVLNIINYHKIHRETFESSHFLFKNKRIEIAFYEYLKDKPKDEWTIHETVLYEMSKNPNDFEIIKNDWGVISEFVRQGKAHELSERHTNYLAPCTKGANAESLRTQPFSPIKAKQRAYSLKSSYMTSILRKYVLGNEKSESIIKDPFILKISDIETIVLERFKQYKGWEIEKLKNHFKIEGDSKQAHHIIAARILNLKGKYSSESAFKKVEEFEKASILLKTVSFNEKSVNKESMSFPAFNFKELASERWENEDGDPEAEWHIFLLETRFLFFIVKEEQGKEIFKGVKFFTVPESDLQGPIRRVWQDTVNKLNSGVKLEGGTRGGKIRISNNFIKKSDELICHIRPHESVADYSCQGRYADELPVKANWVNKPNDEKYSDNWMTKQCFWLNNTYIKEQVKDML